VILLTALCLLAALAIVGAGVVRLTSSDTRLTGTYKLATQALYAAETGTEEARARLRAWPAGAAYLLTDAAPTQAQWAAYLGTSTDAQAYGYSARSLTSLSASLGATLQPPCVPFDGQCTGTVCDPKYTVQIRHQVDAVGNILYWAQ